MANGLFQTIDPSNSAFGIADRFLACLARFLSMPWLASLEGAERPGSRAPGPYGDRWRRCEFERRWLGR
jgi:hypothetical protein